MYYLVLALWLVPIFVVVPLVNITAYHYPSLQFKWKLLHRIQRWIYNELYNYPGIPAVSSDVAAAIFFTSVVSLYWPIAVAILLMKTFVLQMASLIKLLTRLLMKKWGKELKQFVSYFFDFKI